MDQLTRINGSHVLLSVVATITDGDDPGVPIVPTRRRHIVEQEEREDTRRGRPSRFAIAGLGQDQPPNSARGIPVPRCPSLSRVPSAQRAPEASYAEKLSIRNFRSTTLRGRRSLEAFGLLSPRSDFRLALRSESQPVGAPPDSGGMIFFFL